MKRLSLLAGMLLFSFGMKSQIQTPQPSPAGILIQTIGLTEVEVSYSRPSKRGRQVFGNLVPLDKIWRTGANSNTLIRFSDPVEISGIALKAGQYALYSRPGSEFWDLYFYSDTKNSGLPAVWDESKIAAQVRVPAQTLGLDVETFTIAVEAITNNDANLVLSWENTAVTVTVAVPTKSKAMASISSVMSGDSISANEYFAAASYYQDENIDLQQAKQWIDIATTMNPEPYWMLRRKALIYAALSDIEGAIAAAKLSRDAAQKAGNADYVKLNTDSLKEWGVE
ncbi:MAG: hypothetical protein RLZZ241_1810 [Bacteroidota bacterium]|jgi:hypothetical protein